ncbi:MAG: hypothetical protein HRU08_10305 [Oleispira sp.]|nr:hypothetical protein [Oleispira sp.]
MRFLFAIMIISVVSLALFWQPNSQISFWQETTEQLNPTAQQPQTIHSEKTAVSRVKITNTDELSSSDQATGTDFIPDPEAVASLREARLKGDPRAPKLSQHHERELPTAEELGDHEQYIEYERRQQKRVYRAYVEASKIKTAQLRSMIEKGKAEGISDEEIAFAEEKIRGIEEMAIQLQQDHPDIMEDNYQPPADWLIENLGKDDDSIKSNDSEASIAQ